jgi:hypothetical protein
VLVMAQPMEDAETDVGHNSANERSVGEDSLADIAKHFQND